MDVLGHEHDSDGWRLFIDLYKPSLKTMSLHNGNKNPSVPAAHPFHMKGLYENIYHYAKISRSSDS
jgi:hypothetical protein